MDAGQRKAIVAELAAAFGAAEDVTPAPDQSLHVVLPRAQLPPPWRPSAAAALLRFQAWPGTRPEFWIDMAVVNRNNEPPRSSSPQTILGRTWRQFSYSFAWPPAPGHLLTPTRAVEMWLARFREGT